MSTTKYDDLDPYLASGAALRMVAIIHGVTPETDEQLRKRIIASKHLALMPSGSLWQLDLEIETVFEYTLPVTTNPDHARLLLAAYWLPRGKPKWAFVALAWVAKRLLAIFRKRNL